MAKRQGIELLEGEQFEAIGKIVEGGFEPLSGDEEFKTIGRLGEGGFEPLTGDEEFEVVGTAGEEAPPARVAPSASGFSNAFTAAIRPESEEVRSGYVLSAEGALRKQVAGIAAKRSEATGRPVDEILKEYEPGIKSRLAKIERVGRAIAEQDTLRQSIIDRVGKDSERSGLTEEERVGRTNAILKREGLQEVELDAEGGVVSAAADLIKGAVRDGSALISDLVQLPVLAGGYALDVALGEDSDLARSFDGFSIALSRRSQGIRSGEVSPFTLGDSAVEEDLADGEQSMFKASEASETNKYGLNWWARAIGEQVPVFIGLFAGAGVGVGVGKGAVGLAAGRTAGRAALSRIGARRAVSIAQKVGSVGTIGSMEFSHAQHAILEAALQEGYDFDDAMDTSIVGGAVVGIVNSLVELIPFGEHVLRGARGKTLMSAVTGLVKEGGAEAVQESVSTIVEAAAVSGKELDFDELMVRAFDGAIVGGVIGGAMSGSRAFSAGRKAKKAKEALDSAISEDREAARSQLVEVLDGMVGDIAQVDGELVVIDSYTMEDVTDEEGNRRTETKFNIVDREGKRREVDLADVSSATAEAEGLEVGVFGQIIEPEVVEEEAGPTEKQEALFEEDPDSGELKPSEQASTANPDAGNQGDLFGAIDDGQPALFGEQQAMDDARSRRRLARHEQKKKRKGRRARRAVRRRKMAGRLVDVESRVEASTEAASDAFHGTGRQESDRDRRLRIFEERKRKMAAGEPLLPGHLRGDTRPVNGAIPQFESDVDHALFLLGRLAKGGEASRVKAKEVRTWLLEHGMSPEAISKGTGVVSNKVNTLASGVDAGRVFTVNSIAEAEVTEAAKTGGPEASKPAGAGQSARKRTGARAAKPTGGVSPAAITTDTANADTEAEVTETEGDSTPTAEELGTPASRKLAVEPTEAEVEEAEGTDLGTAKPVSKRQQSKKRAKARNEQELARIREAEAEAAAAEEAESGGTEGDVTLMSDLVAEAEAEVRELVTESDLTDAQAEELYEDILDGYIQEIEDQGGTVEDDTVDRSDARQVVDGLDSNTAAETVEIEDLESGDQILLLNSEGTVSHYEVLEADARLRLVRVREIDANEDEFSGMEEGDSEASIVLGDHDIAQSVRLLDGDPGDKARIEQLIEEGPDGVQRLREEEEVLAEQEEESAGDVDTTNDEPVTEEDLEAAERAKTIDNMNRATLELSRERMEATEALAREVDDAIAQGKRPEVLRKLARIALRNSKEIRALMGEAEALSNQLEFDSTSGLALGLSVLEDAAVRLDAIAASIDDKLAADKAAKAAKDGEKVTRLSDGGMLKLGDIEDASRSKSGVLNLRKFVFLAFRRIAQLTDAQIEAIRKRAVGKGSRGRVISQARLRKGGGKVHTSSKSAAADITEHAATPGLAHAAAMRLAEFEDVGDVKTSPEFDAWAKRATSAGVSILIVPRRELSRRGVGAMATPDSGLIIVSEELASGSDTSMIANLMMHELSHVLRADLEMAKAMSPKLIRAMFHEYVARVHRSAVLHDQSARMLAMALKNRDKGWTGKRLAAHQESVKGLVKELISHGTIGNMPTTMEGMYEAIETGLKYYKLMQGNAESETVRLLTQPDIMMTEAGATFIGKMMEDANFRASIESQDRSLYEKFMRMVVEAAEHVLEALRIKTPRKGDVNAREARRHGMRVADAMKNSDLVNEAYRVVSSMGKPTPKPMSAESVEVVDQWASDAGTRPGTAKGKKGLWRKPSGKEVDNPSNLVGKVVVVMEGEGKGTGALPGTVIEVTAYNSRKGTVRGIILKVPEGSRAKEGKAAWFRHRTGNAKRDADARNYDVFEPGKTKLVEQIERNPSDVAPEQVAPEERAKAMGGPLGEAELLLAKALSASAYDGDVTGAIGKDAAKDIFDRKNINARAARVSAALREGREPNEDDVMRIAVAMIPQLRKFAQSMPRSGRASVNDMVANGITGVMAVLRMQKYEGPDGKVRSPGYTKQGKIRMLAFNPKRGTLSTFLIGRPGSAKGPVARMMRDMAKKGKVAREADFAEGDIPIARSSPSDDPEVRVVYNEIIEQVRELQKQGMEASDIAKELSKQIGDGSDENTAAILDLLEGEWFASPADPETLKLKSQGQIDGAEPITVYEVAKLLAAELNKPGSVKGKPDRSQITANEEGRRGVRVVDEAMKRAGVPRRRPDSEILREVAEIEADSDRKDAITQRAKDGGSLSPAEWRVFNEVVGEAAAKAFQSRSIEDLKEAARLVSANRRLRSEWAYQGHAMQDPLRPRRRVPKSPVKQGAGASPEARAQGGEVNGIPDIVREAILNLPPALQKKADKLLRQAAEADARGDGDASKAARSKAEEIFEAWAKKFNLLRKKIMDTTGMDITELTDEELSDPSVGLRLVKVAGQLNSTSSDRVFEWFQAGILSALETNIVNVGASVASIAKEGVWTRPVQAVINGLTGGKNSATFGEVPYVAKGVAEAFGKAFEMFKVAWRVEQPVLEADLRGEGGTDKLDSHRGPAIPGWLGSFVRTGFYITGGRRLLGSTDEALKTFITYTDVYARAYRISNSMPKVDLVTSYANAKANLMKDVATTSDIARFVQEGQKKKEPALRSELRDLLVRDPYSRAWTEALGTARRLTFQEKLGQQGGMLDGAGQVALYMRQMGGSLASFPVGEEESTKGKAINTIVSVLRSPLDVRYHIPFVSVLTNLVRQGVEMIPGSVAFDAGRHVVAKMNDEKAGHKNLMTRDKLTRRIADQAMGLMIYAAIEDAINPDDDDGLPFITGTVPYTLSNQSELYTARSGMEPMSIRVPGTNTMFSYARLDPFATTLATMVDWANARKKAELGANFADSYGKFMQQAFMQVKEKQFAEGLHRAMEVMEAPLRGGPVLLRGMATAFMPNVIRTIQRDADGVIRNRSVDEDSVWETIKAHGRVLGYDVAPTLANMTGSSPPPAVNLWGDDVEEGGEGFTGFLKRFSDPTKAKDTDRVNDLSRAISVWNADHPGDEVHFAPMSRRLTQEAGGVRMQVKLTDTEYYRLQKLGGSVAARILLEAQVNWRDPGWPEMKLMKDAVSAAREQARATIMAEPGVQKRVESTALDTMERLTR